MTSVISTAQRGTTQLHLTPLREGGGAVIVHNVRQRKTGMVVYDAGGERTKCDDMFSRFDTIRLCNGRTDGHLATA